MLKAAERTSASARWPELVSAVERLATAEILDDIVAIVRETARRISGADGVTFVLRDKDNCHYIEENAIGPLWKGKRFPLSACISGWCMDHGETAAIPDIYTDPRIPHDAYRPTFVKSLVMVPVGAPQAVAAIGSYWARQREFVRDELALLEALARSTAAAIGAVAMRKAVNDRETRLTMALAAGRLGAWDWDFLTNKIAATPVCKMHFGRNPHDAFAYDDLVSIAHASDRARLTDALASARRTLADMDIEFRASLPDQSERWLALRGRVCLDENGAPVRMTGVSLDMTDRIRAKDRIDGLQSQLAHMGRVYDISQMVSALAHELNQPLTAARAYMTAARKLLDGRDDTADAHETIEKAGDQFARAAAVIDRTRAFLSKSETRKSAEPVLALVEEAIALSRLDPTHRGVDVVLDMAHGMQPVIADRVQVQQVLLNLLRNAYEAMEADPECVRPEVKIRVRPGRDSGEVEFCVSDNGPGLPPSIAEHLFQPFQTTKDNGMGVGLSICLGLVESNGGTMWLEPSARGASFAFTLPVETPRHAVD